MGFDLEALNNSKLLKFYVQRTGSEIYFLIKNL